VDKTASDHQKILGTLRKRSQNSNLDSTLHVFVGCHFEEKTQFEPEYLRNYTNFERLCF